MDQRFEKMLRRVGNAFYISHIKAVREAVADNLLGQLIRNVSLSRKDLVTVEFRLQAMASAVRQGYAR
mgnify:CR=1 FL=1